MEVRHKMKTVYSDDDLFLTKCEECSRVVVMFFDKKRGYVAVDKGDPQAYHTGSTSVFGLNISVDGDINQSPDNFNPFDTETYNYE
jgi:hypothetical protein